MLDFTGDLSIIALRKSLQRHVVKTSFRSLFSIFLSLSILLAGHGLQQTLLPLAAQSLGWSPAEIGLTGSAYFIGFLLGCFCVPLLIRRVGHIRVFAVCSALAVVAILAVQSWQVMPIWIVARAFTGLSFAGLYMVLESWLNERSPVESRGRVLSFYGFLSLAAMSVGQLLVFDASLVSGASLVAVLFCLAIVPVALTTSPQPEVPSEVNLSFGLAYRASQVGPILAGVSGFVMGLVWSNGAVYASTIEPNLGARFIMATLMGGLVCQLPIGRLSDRVDRRWVLLGLCIVACIAIAATLFVGLSEVSLCALGFVLGATAMPMYSLAIAHANDNADGRYLVIASAMLVANGIGATIGPMIYGGLNALGVTSVYFLVIGVAYFLGAIWTASRLAIRDSDRDYFDPYQLLPKTTQGVADIDPRNVDPE